MEVCIIGLGLLGGSFSLALKSAREDIEVIGVDINPDNSVSSIKVANAQITYGGKGAIAAANKPGWMARFFLSPWMPF